VASATCDLYRQMSPQSATPIECDYCDDDVRVKKFCSHCGIRCWRVNTVNNTNKHSQHTQRQAQQVEQTFSIWLFPQTNLN